MRCIAITLLVSGCLLVQLNSGSQEILLPFKKSSQYSSRKDWFLSTGNWQFDPQLYVCEFGSGKDTVVMLHGGWGGDYSGICSRQ